MLQPMGWEACFSRWGGRHASLDGVGKCPHRKMGWAYAHPIQSEAAMPMSQARSGCRHNHPACRQQGSLRMDLLLGPDVGAKVRVVAGIDAVGPESALPLKIGQARDIHPDPAARVGLEGCHQSGKGEIGGHPRVEMDVVQPSIDLDWTALLPLRNISKNKDHLAPQRWLQAQLPVLGRPDQMNPNSHDGSRHGASDQHPSRPRATPHHPFVRAIICVTPTNRAFAVLGAGVCPPLARRPAKPRRPGMPRRPPRGFAKPKRAHPLGWTRLDFVPRRASG